MRIIPVTLKSGNIPVVVTVLCVQLQRVIRLNVKRPHTRITYYKNDNDDDEHSEKIRYLVHTDSKTCGCQMYVQCIWYVVYMCDKSFA